VGVPISLTPAADHFVVKRRTHLIRSVSATQAKNGPLSRRVGRGTDIRIWPLGRDVFLRLASCRRRLRRSKGWFRSLCLDRP
jgi:hypothetical protein